MHFLGILLTQIQRIHAQNQLHLRRLLSTLGNIDSMQPVIVFERRVVIVTANDTVLGFLLNGAGIGPNTCKLQLLLIEERRQLRTMHFSASSE